jgi:Tfp pilus assembly protein PilF
MLVGLLGLCAGCQTAPLSGPGGSAPLTGGPRRAEKDLPPEQSARLCLATAQEMEKGGAEAQAIALYEKARKDDPRQEQVCRRLAVLYDRLGNCQKSLEEYQRALQLTPRDPDLLNDLGYSYYVHGKLSEAEGYLRQATVLNAKHARAWINLGLVLGAERRYGECVDAFTKAVAPAQAHCNLAFIYTTQQMWEEAKQEYRTALGLDSNLVVAQAALDKLEHPKTAVAAGQSAPGTRPAPAVAAAPAASPDAPPAAQWQSGGNPAPLPEPLAYGGFVPTTGQQ